MSQNISLQTTKFETNDIADVIDDTVKVTSFCVHIPGCGTFFPKKMNSDPGKCRQGHEYTRVLTPSVLGIDQSGPPFLTC